MASMPTATTAEATAPVDGRTAPSSKPRIWTPTFGFLCTSILFAAAGQSLTYPALPLFLHSLNASETLIGLILAVFSFSSVAARPFVGYWADRWRAVAVAGLGGVLLALTGFVYMTPLILVVAGAAVVRGFGWAAFNTGAYSLLAHIAPPSRRGEASSFFNLFSNSGHAFFPAVAVWLIATPGAGFPVVFLVCGCLGLVTVLFVWGIHRSAPGSALQQVVPQAEGPRPRGLAAFVDRPVLLATALLGCITLTHPAYTFFLPLYAQYRGIENVGWYYAINGVAGILAYGFVGTQSDRLGRGASLAIGFGFGVIGLFLMMIATSFWVLIVAGIIYSVGQAVAIPNTMALAIDRAHPQRRGAAMGTYTLAYTSGQGIGSAIAGGVIEFVGYEAMYAIAIVCMATGLVLTARNWPALRRGVPSPYPAQ